MSATDKALELLAKLNAADRSWILGRLSPDAKSRLMAAREEGSTASASAASRPAAQGDESSLAALIDRVAAADPDAVASALAGEPAWLVSAVLLIHDWPWTKRFLQGLSPALRVEVIQLERHGTSLARPARELVLRALVTRMGTSWAVAAPATRFDAVLTRIRKVRRA
jgi:hypothetical protein